MWLNENYGAPQAPKIFYFQYHHIRHILWNFGICSTSTSKSVAFFKEDPQKLWSEPCKIEKLRPLFSSKIIFSWWNLAKIFILMIEIRRNYLLSFFAKFPDSPRFPPKNDNFGSTLPWNSRSGNPINTISCIDMTFATMYLSLGKKIKSLSFFSLQILTIQKYP